jgi:hypothetical protein
MTATTSKLGADMTDAQILEIADAHMQWGKVCYVNADRRTIPAFARAILARQPAAIGKEAVAWFDKERNTLRWRDGLVNADFRDGQPFYAAPLANEASKPATTKYDPHDPGNWRDGDDAMGNASPPSVAQSVAEKCARLAELYRDEHAMSGQEEAICNAIAEACRDYGSANVAQGAEAGWDAKGIKLTHSQRVAISQFLSDVMTAAGLISHGKQCKALGARLGERCMALHTLLDRQSATPLAMPSEEEVIAAAEYNWSTVSFDENGDSIYHFEKDYLQRFAKSLFAAAEEKQYASADAIDAEIHRLLELKIERFPEYAKSLLEGYATKVEVFDHMIKVAHAAGFESLTEAISVAKKSRANVAQGTEENDLLKFLDVAAGKGYVFDGVDAGDLYQKLFPNAFKAALTAAQPASGDTQ